MYCIMKNKRTLLIVLPFAGIFHCYMEYARLKGTAGSDVSLKDIGIQTDLRVYLHLRQTWLAFSKSTAYVLVEESTCGGLVVRGADCLLVILVVLGAGMVHVYSLLGHKLHWW